MSTRKDSGASASSRSAASTPPPTPHVDVAIVLSDSPPPASSQTFLNSRDGAQTRSGLLSAMLHSSPDFRGLLSTQEKKDVRSSVSALCSECDANGCSPVSRNESSALARNVAPVPAQPVPGQTQVRVLSLMRPHAVALNVIPGSEPAREGVVPSRTAGEHSSRALSITSLKDSESDVSTNPETTMPAHTASHPNPAVEAFLIRIEQLENARGITPASERSTTVPYRRKGTQVFQASTTSDRPSSCGSQSSVPLTCDRVCRRPHPVCEELSQRTSEATDTPLSSWTANAGTPFSRHSRRVVHITMPTHPAEKDDVEEESNLDADLNAEDSAISSARCVGGGLYEVPLVEAEGNAVIPHQWSFPVPPAEPVQSACHMPSPAHHRHRVQPLKRAEMATVTAAQAPATLHGGTSPQLALASHGLAIPVAVTASVGEFEKQPVQQHLTAEAAGLEAGIDSKETTNLTTHSGSQSWRLTTCTATELNNMLVSASGLPPFVPPRARPVRQSSGGAANGLRRLFSTPSLTEEGVAATSRSSVDAQGQSHASLRLGRVSPHSLVNSSSRIAWPMNLSTRQADLLNASVLSGLQLDSTYPMMAFSAQNSMALPDTFRDEDDSTLTGSQSAAAAAEFARHYLAQLAPRSAVTAPGGARQADPAVAITSANTDTQSPASELETLLARFRNLAIFAVDNKDVEEDDADETQEATAHDHTISTRRRSSTHASTTTAHPPRELPDCNEQPFRDLFAHVSPEQNVTDMETCVPLKDHHRNIASESPPDLPHFEFPSMSLLRKELAQASVHSGVSGDGTINTVAARVSDAQHNPLMTAVGAPRRISPVASIASNKFATAVPAASTFNTSETRRNSAYVGTQHPSFVGLLASEFTNSGTTSRGSLTGSKTPSQRSHVSSLAHFASGANVSPDARMPLSTRRLYASGHDSPGDAHPRRGSVSAKGTRWAPTFASKRASFRMDTGDMSPRFPLLASTMDDQSESLSARRVLATPPEYDADVPALRHYAECSTFTLGSVDEGEFSQSVWD